MRSEGSRFLDGAGGRSRGARRFRWLLVLTLVLAAVLIARLFELSVLAHEDWAHKRRQNILGSEFLDAARGPILDRLGRCLCHDEMRFELGIRYRLFRRGHPLALLRHLDGLMRDMAGDPEVAVALRRRFPAGLVAGEPLRYTDPPERIALALGALCRLPVASFRTGGQDSRAVLSSLRFHCFALLSQVAERGGMDQEHRVALAFDRLGSEAEGRTLAAALGPVLLDGPGASARLETCLVDRVLEARAELCALERLLEQEPVPPRIGVLATLEAWYGRFGRYVEGKARLLAERRAERDRRLADESLGAWIARMFLGEERLEDDDFETRLRWRYDFENSVQSLLGPVSVSFERVVARVEGRRESYPGFLVQERYGRVYDVGTEDRRLPARNDEEAGVLRGLPPLVLGHVVRSTGALPAPTPDEVEGPDALPELELSRTPSVDGLGGTELQLDAEAFRDLGGHLRQQAWFAGHLPINIGASNLEAALDDWLGGEGGLRTELKNRLGEELRMPNYGPPRPGSEVRLTIDWELQVALERAFLDALEELGFGLDDPITGSYGAAASCLIDAATGEVLAMVSTPRALPTRDGSRWVPVWAHYALGGSRHTNHLGSTVKPFLAVEGLHRHPLLGEDFTDCKGAYIGRDGSLHGHRYYQGQAEIRCHAHGSVVGSDGVEEALQESCNAFFTQLGHRLGEDGVAEALRRFGLWADLDEDWQQPLGLPIRRPGPILRWDARQGRYLPAFRFEGDRLGIGYGVQAAPLLVARAYAGLATGRLPWLRIVHSIDGAPVRSTAQDLGLSPELLDRARKGLLRGVVRGTVKPPARDDLQALGAVGKTGTALWYLAGPEGRSHKRLNAWFSGWLPYDSPRLAFSTVLYGTDPERQGDAGRTAARVVGTVLRRLVADERFRPYFEGRRRPGEDG